MKAVSLRHPETGLGPEGSGNPRSISSRTCVLFSCRIRLFYPLMPEGWHQCPANTLTLWPFHLHHIPTQNPRLNTLTCHRFSLAPLKLHAVPLPSEITCISTVRYNRSGTSSSPVAQCVCVVCRGWSLSVSLKTLLCFSQTPTDDTHPHPAPKSSCIQIPVRNQRSHWSFHANQSDLAKIRYPSACLVESRYCPAHSHLNHPAQRLVHQC